MIKNKMICTVCIWLIMCSAILAEPFLQVGAGPAYQMVRDLNTSSLIWKATGPSGSIDLQTDMRSGMTYQVGIAVASGKFNPSEENYFSLISTTVIEMMTRFLKPVWTSGSMDLLVGAGFTSPVISIRHSNLWSMTTALEGTIDLTANAGIRWEKDKWKASALFDLPVASLALVQDYSASGNHVMRFASFHNSFQLFGELTCLYKVSGHAGLGIEADIARRSFSVIKAVDTWSYAINLIYRVEW